MHAVEDLIASEDLSDVALSFFFAACCVTTVTTRS